MAKYRFFATTFSETLDTPPGGKLFSRKKTAFVKEKHVFMKDTSVHFTDYSIAKIVCSSA